MLKVPLHCCLCDHSPTLRNARGDFFFCGPCHQEIVKLTVQEKEDVGFFKTFGMYHYQGIIKNLIRKAKIGNEYRARRILLSLFLNSSAIRWGYWADFVIPAPSSIWGRSRGRVDLSAALSHELAKISRNKLVYPPWLLYGRFTKKALLHNSTSRTQSDLLSRFGAKVWHRLWSEQGVHWVNSILKNGPEILKIVLIDDVVTTGRTLHETAEYIQNLLKDVRSVTICKIALAQSPDY